MKGMAKQIRNRQYANDAAREKVCLIIITLAEWSRLPKRSKVSDGKRTAILERDKHRCRFCKGKSDLEIDHIVPVSFGGTNDLTNLRVLCRACNTGRNTFEFLYFKDGRLGWAPSSRDRRLLTKNG